MRNQQLFVLGLLVAGCHFGQQPANVQPQLKDNDPKLVAQAQVIDVTPTTKLPKEAEIDAMRTSMCSAAPAEKWETMIYLQLRYSDGSLDSYLCDHSTHGHSPKGPAFVDQFKQKFASARSASCKKRSAVALTDVSPQQDKYTGYCDGRLVIQYANGAGSTENILGGTLTAGAEAVGFKVAGYEVSMDVPETVHATSQGKVATLEGPGFSMQVRRYTGDGGRALIARGTVADKIEEESEYRVIYRSRGALRFAEMFELHDDQLIVESSPGRAFTLAQIKKMSEAAQTMRVQ